MENDARLKTLLQRLKDAWKWGGGGGDRRAGDREKRSGRRKGVGRQEGGNLGEKRREAGEEREGCGISQAVGEREVQTPPPPPPPPPPPHAHIFVTTSLLYIVYIKGRLACLSDLPISSKQDEIYLL